MRAQCRDWGRGRGCTPMLLEGTQCPSPGVEGASTAHGPGDGDEPFPGLWGREDLGLHRGSAGPSVPPSLRTWAGGVGDIGGMQGLLGTRVS